MAPARYEADAAVFGAFGFGVEHLVNVCSVCKQRAIVSLCSCAERTRYKKTVLVNMELRSVAPA